MGLLSLVLPWYSVTVQAMGLRSQHSLTNEFAYWASLAKTDPQAALLLDAAARVWIAATIPILVILGAVLALVKFRRRVASLFGGLSIAAALAAFEYGLRPFGNVAVGTGIVTAPSEGFYIAFLSALILITGYLIAPKQGSPQKKTRPTSPLGK